MIFAAGKKPGPLGRSPGGCRGSVPPRYFHACWSLLNPPEMAPFYPAANNHLDRLLADHDVRVVQVSVLHAPLVDVRNSTRDCCAYGPGFSDGELWPLEPLG